MSESAMILHHYALSPFSEKVRAMLGYAGLSWQSVTTDEMPPRPMLAPLAGGYRKIPVAQIGADVFCDTRTITREIARLSGKPELALEGVDEEVRAFVAETDLALFMAVMMSSVGLRVNIKLFRALSFGQLLRFFKDRIQIGRTSTVPRISLKEARARTREHLADMETRLQAQPWLFGDKPCIADFSAYHALWFLREVAESTMLQPFPSVLAWMDRIKAFGQGASTPLSQQRWRLPVKPVRVRCLKQPRKTLCRVKPFRLRPRIMVRCPPPARWYTATKTISSWRCSTQGMRL